MELLATPNDRLHGPFGPARGHSRRPSPWLRHGHRHRATTDTVLPLTQCYHARVTELLKKLGPLRLIALCSPIYLCGCQPAAEDPCSQFAPGPLTPFEIEVESAELSTLNLRAWVAGLTSPALEGRHAGEPGARAAAAWVAGQMTTLGLDSGESGFCRSFTLYGDGEDYNVIGHLSNGPSAGDRPVILVGAHYDGQGRHPAGQIYPGADDNASGVAALLEVARLAKRHPSASADTSAAETSSTETSTRPIDWVFVAFGAEEVGQLGARNFLADTSIELSRIELVINLDMVGRPLGPDAREAIGYLTFGERSQLIMPDLDQAARDAGVEIVSLEDFGDLKPMITDAEVLAQRLPTLLLSTALHSDHHRVSDTPDRVDYAQIRRASALVLALANIIVDHS